MSGVMWSTAEASKVGLLLSAIHTLGEGWIAPPGEAASPMLKDPAEQSGNFRLTLTSAALKPTKVMAPTFMMFHPAVPAAETGNRMHDILPRHDFYLSAVDGQRFVVRDDTHIGVMPSALTPTLPEVFDPEGHLTRPGADAAAGDRVLMVGYPMQGPVAGGLAASVGEVLDETGVQKAMAELRTAGDEEGSLPYDAEVEHIVRGSAVAGMSGGGVFDVEGRLVGVLVRGSTETEPPGYARFVRLPFIVSTIRAVFDELPGDERASLGRYLPPSAVPSSP